ncbi:MAG TPA: tryptophan--tRNA ligase, partial [Candidatus Sumerlaeia bacterium]|nr:tryptophan--tRNA ligase [Candidatus Sumerlaeia bacterium]
PGRRRRRALGRPARVRRSDKGHPEVCSVFDYHKVFTRERAAEIEQGCRDAALGCVECKKILMASLKTLLEPMRIRREELLKKPDTVRFVIEDGNRRASEAAEKTMIEVREALRLVP